MLIVQPATGIRSREGVLVGAELGQASTTL